MWPFQFCSTRSLPHSSGKTREIWNRSSKTSTWLALTISGLPFWVSVAVVEIAILDLLGKVFGQPIGALIGTPRQRQIPVYRASSHRGNSPEDEIAYLQKVVAGTGATAIKFRLGARMRFDAESTRRDLALRLAK